MAQRPATASEREAALQRYLDSLAEKPARLSLADIAVTSQSHEAVRVPKEVSSASSIRGKIRNLSQRDCLTKTKPYVAIHCSKALSLRIVR